MSIARFMTEALTHPVHGYYMQRDPFGAAGDFITAPEISQMFGELIGLWCADQWQRMGAPAQAWLVELGPGRGTLMADALRALKALPGATASLRPCLVEVSPHLRQKQCETIQRRDALWVDDIAQIPAGPAIIIANEFFDALPIRQYVKAGTGWHERLVDVSDDEKLRFVLTPRPVAIETFLPAALRDAEAGSIVEISAASRAIAADLATRLVEQCGAALIIDYGPASAGAGDTFQAVRRHQFEPVLENPGEADLTAHVDFSSIAIAARRVGGASFGPVPQGLWLERLGIGERSLALQRANPTGAEAIVAGAQRLTAPDAMGTLFKVMAVTDPKLAAAGPPAGFD